MSSSEIPATSVVVTVPDLCRRCYSCVRSCPAKAIRVQGGQAQVMPERCIGCGNCIRVCAQHAKQVRSAAEVVSELLAADAPAVAILAPSYPGAYRDVSAGQLVAAVRALGFQRVMEVGFGAEMVAHEYARLLRRGTDRPLISTACPALVSYVCKHMPELVPNLAPVVSPMIALGRAVKQHYLPGASVVFIGPCVAKKAELADPEVAGAVDAAFSFMGLERMLKERGVDPTSLKPDWPDEPLPHYGALFPVSGGLLRAAAIQADLMDDSILVVEGPERCLAALQEMREGRFTPRFLDALLCEGCIAGPAYSDGLSPLIRKQRVTEHVRELRARARQLPRSLRSVASVDVTRGFVPQAIAQRMPTETELRDILAQTNKTSPEHELNCGACGYATCREKAVAVYQGLAEPEMCLPFLIDQLQVNLDRLHRSQEEIRKAREAVSRAEELASMGQLASNIARQLSDPLGKMVTFAQRLRGGLAEDDPRQADASTLITEALQCRQVMSSLLAFARQHEPHWERIEVPALVQRALEQTAPRLALTSVAVKQVIEPDLPPIMADPALMSQVLVNLLTNSLDALGDTGTITVEARRAASAEAVELTVRDDGPGIPAQVLPRLFQPFVTTKEDRPGAGLGLAVAHGVVQAHGGEITVDSQPGQGTAVTVRLPVDAPAGRPPQAARVLVVDDDPDFLEQHRILLTATGFDVVTAERSDEAIEVADREIPDAFVLDMMMERTDSGARLARALRRDPRFRNAPIVILTSVVQDMGFEFYRNPREVLEWMKADAWFEKPAPIAELSGTLRRLLTERAPDTGAPDSAGETASGAEARDDATLVSAGPEQTKP